MAKLKTERNPVLDYFKILLSILVITIHIFPLFDTSSFSSWAISVGLARIAVPCFFVISGYFIATKIESFKSIIKYTKHLVVIYVVWAIIYLPYHEIYLSHTGYITLKKRLNFLLFEYFQLWFIPALVVGILMLFIIKRYLKKDMYILTLAIILFVIGYTMQYASYSVSMYRNGIFLGYPFIAIGYYIYRKNLISKLSTKTLSIGSAILLFTLLFESYLAFIIEHGRETYISLFILCPLLFILVMKYPKRTASNIYLDKLSAGIFYIHFLVIFNLPNPHYPYRIFDLPLIFIISAILSIFIIFINKRIKIFL